MLFQVDYSYYKGPTGPYEDTIYIEAQTISEVENKFNQYKEKYHPNSFTNNEGKEVKLMSSGTIYKVTRLGELQVIK